MSKKFKNENELLEFTNNLLGKNVNELFTCDQINSIKGKGKLGQLVEKHFYGYELNSDKRPDFKELGIELKVTPMHKNKNGTLSQKERLSLSMVSHEDLINNVDITNSDLWSKINKMLIIWYLHSKDFNLNRFQYYKLVELIGDDFLEVINNDWKIIRDMYIEGRAHELSERLTKILGVARKGAGGQENKVKQPYSDIKYYKRAFTIKQTFMRSLLKEVLLYEKEAVDFNKENNFVEYMRDVLVGEKIRDICDSKYLMKESEGEKIAKQIASISVLNKLGFSKMDYITKYVEENEGEFITFKTVPVVRRKDGSYRIKEDFKINVPISDEAINVPWDKSRFSKIFESKFVAIIYEFNGENILDSRIVDIKEFDFNDTNYDFVIDAYNEFRERALNGNLVSKNGNVNFIKKSDGKNVHFRPWATNKKDMFKTARGEEGTKTAIWLNNDFIEKIFSWV